MPLFVFGMNHRTASLALRERYGKPLELLVFPTARLNENEEMLFLSTCNRVEGYFVTFSKARAWNYYIENLRRLGGEPPKGNKWFYFYHEKEALHHLFRVATSLDSLVVGENQILHQVKQAYAFAKNQGWTGPVLNRVFQWTLHVAKEVRHQTQIARLPVSVASIAVDLAGKIFENLNEHSAVLFGAGEMGRQAARCLRENGLSHLWLASRNPAKVSALAKEINAKTCPLEEALGKIAEVDLVITALSHASAFLNEQKLQGVLEKRGGRRLLILDLGVPRNVSEELGKKPGVYLYAVDDLEGMAAKNKEQRAHAASEAEDKIQKASEEAYGRLQEMTTTPFIVELRRSFEAQRRLVLREFFKKNDVPLSLRRKFDLTTRLWLNRALHGPTVRLKKQLRHPDRKHYEDFLKEIFGLKDE